MKLTENLIGNLYLLLLSINKEKHLKALRHIDCCKFDAPSVHVTPSEQLDVGGLRPFLTIQFLTTLNTHYLENLSGTIL